MYLLHMYPDMAKQAEAAPEKSTGIQVTEQSAQTTLLLRNLGLLTLIGSLVQLTQLFRRLHTISQARMVDLYRCRGRRQQVEAGAHRDMKQITFTMLASIQAVVS